MNLDLINHLTLIQFVILVLASFRITRFITMDTVPVVARPRVWLLRKFPPEGAYVDGPTKSKWYHVVPVGAGRFVVTRGHWLGDMLSCTWCSGWWVSLAIAVSWWFAPVATVLLALPWAIAGASAFIATKE